MPRRLVLVVSLAVLVCAPLVLRAERSASAATVINVPADQPSIQGAIDVAANGDQVVVAPGTYSEHLDFHGKAIEVRSAAGPATTIVDGGGVGPVVRFDTGESTAAVLRGFTVQHGYASSGAGVYISNASPTVVGNTIANNDAQDWGGGVYILDGSPVIDSNQVSDNLAVAGAGIFLQSGAPVIRDNEIARNKQSHGTGGTGGGGIFLGGPALVTGNTIENNQQLGSSNGGGISINHAGAVRIIGNVIRGNASNANGGGISALNDGGSIIVQNLVVGNLGDGIWISVGSSPITVTNNTVAANTGFGLRTTGFAAGATLTNNILSGGLLCETTFSSIPPVVRSTNASTFSGACASLQGTSGNTSADPQFVDATNADFHVTASSPSVDAGDNGAAELPTNDFDGQPRIGAGRVDQGVYELAAASDASGEFTALTPARLLDTRDGTGRPGVGPLAGGFAADVQITGRGGVPASGVSAVVLNVTVTQPDAAGYLTVWPTGLPRPTVSNLNFVPGQTVANMVTVGVGTGGKVSVAANTGSTHAIFDVVGFYASATGPHGTTFHSIGPSRLFDTRIGSGGVARKRVAGGSALRFKVTGVNGVPASGVSAIVMNVTVTNTTTFGSFLAVYPDDVARPVASSLNFTSGQTVPNLVTVRVPADGIVDFYNSSGSTDLLADVAGYYGPATNTDAGRFYAVAPTRLLDTRQASPFPAPGAVPAGKSLLLPLLSRGGLPSGGVASAVTNITVTQPTGTGFITATPADIGVPVASNLNFVPGQTVPNLAIVRVSQGTPPPPNPQTPGWIALYNSAGSTHLVLDVFGYFTALAPNVVGASE